ncbi:MAG: hypothetical protein HQK84_05465 [Nitrospinae bacterium]|nr:hypothetical protein [Nitrospinota bacterium]
MRKVLFLPLVFSCLFLFTGISYAGSKTTICHCPPGLGGQSCKTLSVGSSAVSSHTGNHSYDHTGACTETELEASTSVSGYDPTNYDYDPTNYDLGSGTKGGFSVPKAGGSNWKEN